MSEPVTTLGAKLRELAAEHGSGVTQLGTLFVRVTRHGNDWALELNDEPYVDSDTIGDWEQATGVPSGTMWHIESHGRVWRCEWTGTEDAAPEGTRAFYLGGAK